MLLAVPQLHNTAEAPCALQTELIWCTAHDHMPCLQACRHAPLPGRWRATAADCMEAKAFRPWADLTLFFSGMRSPHLSALNPPTSALRWL